MNQDAARSRVAWMIAASLAVVALMLQTRLPLNADAAWILSVAGRVLGGERLYRDVIEINPPLIVWLQLPIVLAARALAVSPEIAYRVALAACAFVSALATGGVLSRSAVVPSGVLRWTPTFVLVTLLVLPGGAFGQREQWIAILLFPFLALSVVRLTAGRVGALLAVAIGASAGLGIALKPHYAGIWILLAACSFATAGRKRVRILPEDAAIVATGLIYVLLVLAFAADFVSLVRIYGGAYQLYTTMNRAQILLETAAIIWFAVVLVAWVVRRDWRHDPLGTVLAVAGAGAVLAGVLQGKGWTYHFYPAVAISILLGSLALLVPTGADQTSVQRAARSLAALLVLVSWAPLVWAVSGQLAGVARNATDVVEQGQLEAVLARETGAQSALVLSSDMTAASAGFPRLGIRSVNSLPCLWVPAVVYHTRWNGNPDIALRSESAMTTAELAEYRTVITDFVVKSPDLLVVESRRKNERFTGYPGGFDHLAYYGSDSAFARCMGSYSQVAELGGFSVFRRSSARCG